MKLRSGAFDQQRISWIVLKKLENVYFESQKKTKKPKVKDIKNPFPVT